MPIDPSVAPLFDHVRIDALSDGDIEFWACVLDASPAELRHAIGMVGTDVSAVRRYLAQPSLACAGMH